MKSRAPSPVLALLLPWPSWPPWPWGMPTSGPARCCGPWPGRGDDLARTVVWDLRLPRTLVGMAVGAGLAASGVAMQAFFRNALASPGLLGVSAGGALGAVAALALGGAAASVWTVPVASILGPSWPPARWCSWPGGAPAPSTCCCPAWP